MLSYILWTSLLIFFISYLALNYKVIHLGTLSIRTKWSDLKRGDWIMFAGIFQVLVVLIAAAIIAYTRTN